MIKERKPIIGIIKSEHITDHTFFENEIKANLLVGKFMLACAGGLAVCWLLNVLKVLAISQEYILYIFPVGIFMFLSTAGVCLALKGRKRWIKYMTMLSLILTLAYLDSILTYNVPLFIIIPVAFSCWYYSRAFTVRVSVLTTVFFTVSAFCGAYFNMDTPDKNFMTGELSSYLRAVMLQSFLPKWMLFAVISAVCYVIASRGRAMVLKQDTVSKFQARVETELDMATRIQSQALPIVDDLPVSRYRQFDLAAKMMPAREVGGDFYDFFYIDDTHLALMIADVADKGIAASLYMMMSKLMLDNKLTECPSPGQVLEEVNRQLHKKSLKGMFVTVWLGILDLKTGDLISANAGHEYPIIKHGSNGFELFRDRHGFVLGGVSSMKYPEAQMHLDEGDILFVYTDGVTEANAPDGTQYTEQRLITALNKNAAGTMNVLIENVKHDIGTFASGSAQFDDITMLALRLGAPVFKSLISLRPVMPELDRVQEFVGQAAVQAKMQELQAKKIHICVDEIFSNIVKYSGASAVSLSCTLDRDKVLLTFSDDGSPFDPLSGKPPDISLPVSERINEGLGIFITKSYADCTEYTRTDGKNVLTLTFNIALKEG